MHFVVPLWLSGAIAVMGSGRDSAMTAGRLSFTHAQDEESSLVLKSQMIPHVFCSKLEGFLLKGHMSFL